jgi:hypothetical protein
MSDQSIENHFLPANEFLPARVKTPEGRPRENYFLTQIGRVMENIC